MKELILNLAKEHNLKAVELFVKRKIVCKINILYLDTIYLENFDVKFNKKTKSIRLTKK